MSTNSTDSHSSPKEKPWHQVEIIQTSKETPSIANVTLQVQTGNNDPLTFLPGQWIDFLIDIPNHENGTTREYIGGYSPLSSPSSLPIMELGIRFNPHHAVSNYLHQFANKSDNDSSQDQQQLSLQAKIRGGSGTCVYVPKLNDPTITFLAGGIGITPILSMVQSALEFSQNTNPGSSKLTLKLFYSIRSVEEFAYKDILLDLAQKYNDNFQLFITITQDENTSNCSFQKFHKGRWDFNYILSNVLGTHNHNITDYSNDQSVFYLCGPPTMVDTFFDDLVIQRKFSKNQVKLEKWW